MVTLIEVWSWWKKREASCYDSCVSSSPSRRRFVRMCGMGRMKGWCLRVGEMLVVDDVVWELRSPNCGMVAIRAL